MSDQVTVFFATAKAPWRRILYALRRGKVVVAWYALLARLARILTWSEYGHCCVCAGACVFDRRLGEAKVWLLSEFMDKYPTLSHAYIVPTPYPASIKHIHTSGRIKIIPTLIKWMTRGVLETDDCACVTRRVLWNAGVDVPRSVCSPAKLDKWLSSQGFRRIEL